MTEKSVELSITVKVYGEVIEYKREIAIAELETGISQVVQEMGTAVMVAGLKGLDQELHKEVPAGWRNVGTEERSLMSSIGRIRYQRRIYKDEKGVMRSWEWSDIAEIVSEYDKWEPIWPVKGPIGERRAR